MIPDEETESFEAINHRCAWQSAIQPRRSAKSHRTLLEKLTKAYAIAPGEAEERKGTICLDNPDKYGAPYERNMDIKIGTKVSNGPERRDRRALKNVRPLLRARADADSYVNEQFQRLSLSLSVSLSFSADSRL